MAALNNLDLRLLKAFVAIIECAGFQRAQSRLGVSASTVSTYMSTLESRLGVRLCQRGRVGFRLTEKGEAVAAATKRLLAAVDTFELEVGEARGPLIGRLRLGLIDNIVTNRQAPLQEVIGRFIARAPQVEMHVEIAEPHLLERGLLDGRLHVAIGPFGKGVAGLREQPLFSERHRLYCGQAHALFERCPNRVRREDLVDQRFVARTYSRGADARRVGISRASAFVANVEAQIILILSGAYIGYLPEHYAAPFVDDGSLRRIDIPRTAFGSLFSLVVRRGTTLPGVVQAFRDEITAMFPPPGRREHSGNLQS